MKHRIWLQIIICISILGCVTTPVQSVEIDIGTVSIKAVKINGQPITATNQITVIPGDQIECDIFLSDWASNDFVYAVRGYEVNLNPESFFGGDQGTVLPLGWYAPYHERTCSNDGDCNGSVCDSNFLVCDAISCVNDSDCTGSFPICKDIGRGRQEVNSCVALDHETTLGAFVDETRSNFIFFRNTQGLIGLVRDVTLKYAFASVLFFDGVEDPGFPVYLGTVVLDVSEASDLSGEACGIFEIEFFTNSPQLNTCQSANNLADLNILIGCPTIESLIINVDCSEQGEPEPVFVPAVSLWGMVVLVLLLMIAISIYFGRYRNQSSQGM